MIGSSLKRSWKGIANQRLFMLLNLGGLSLGLACCLLIGLFVWREASYDSQYARADDIYLAVETWQQPVGPVSLGEHSSQQLAAVLSGSLAGVEAVGRYQASLASMHVRGEQLAADETAVHFVDPEVLHIFDFEWLSGGPEGAFTTPDAIVLTRQVAEKYFGSVDVAGRTLTVNVDTEVRISGVVDKPATTILDFRALLPMALQERWAREEGRQVLGGSQVRTFVLLDGQSTLADAEAALPALLERQAEFLNTFHPPAPLVSVELKPLRSIYHERYFQSNEDGLSNGERMQVFAAIAACVLLIAVMNYMNLSTSRYSARALEVGVSLALGSGRAVLIRRFLAETFVFTAVAMLLGLMWVETLLPVLNAYVGMELALSDIPLYTLGTLLLAGTLLVSLLAGYYPALYLSHADPSRILRGDLTRGRAGVRLREGLVVLQFAAAISLLVIATVMYGQLRHLQTLDRGFDPENVLTIDVPSAESFNLAGQWEGFASRLLQIPGVIDLTLGIDSPLRTYGIGANAVAGDAEATLSLIPVLPDYLQFYDIELLAGRQFMDSSMEDTARFGLLRAATEQAPKGAFVLSSSAVRMLGWTRDEALGQVLTVNGWGMGSGTVVGVVEDTISNSNQERGALLYLVPETLNFTPYNGTVSLKTAAGELPGIQQGIRALWDEYFPALPMHIVFLEDRIQADYRQEANQQQFFAVSALLAVLIACLGLYGLAVFNAEHRTKEIGVRKVMGSSVWRIVLLLTRDFSKLVLIANVLAWPFAWVVMQRWLEQFAYRIDLTLMIFVGSSLIALCVAWVTVGGTAAKAASHKPVLALRYE